MALDYTNCNLCGRYCNINRYEKAGYCKTTDRLIISSYLLHFGEEPPISGANGSGTIFFSGCSLGCAFCQNYQISAELEGNSYNIEQLAEMFIKLQNQQAHNINLVTPTHFTPSIKKAFYLVKNKGFFLPIVYNSSGFDSPENLKFIDEIVDIYLPDFKFIDSELSKRYCNAENYPDIAKKNMEIMIKSKGLLKLENDIAKSGVLIRHLVMPNAIENTIEILEYLRVNFGNDIYMSIMSQYAPRYKSKKYNEINRGLKKKEYDIVMNYLIKYDMDNVYVQELMS
ncbi:MAG TPA: radical SAM protein, partial [bacterium]|nr:radical SAM protein [bacterium]